jgi:hypothetical protein
MNDELQTPKNYEDLKDLILMITQETPNNMELGDKMRKIAGSLKDNKHIDIKELTKNPIYYGR